jgi:virulence-associated protein VagC
MTTQTFQGERGQAVWLPIGFEFAEEEVAIRREGNSVVLEPVKAKAWPAAFFERIRIEDPKFQRPSQGEMPAAPSFNDV